MSREESRARRRDSSATLGMTWVTVLGNDMGDGLGVAVGVAGMTVVVVVGVAVATLGNGGLYG